MRTVTFQHVVQPVPGAFGLGAQVAPVVLVELAIAGLAADHLDTASAHGVDLAGIVGQQLDARDGKGLEHLQRDMIAAFVVAEAQHLVGVDGIQAVVLQVVGPQLVGQTDTPPFLGEVQQNAATAFGDGGHAAAQLLAAIAAQAAEQVAGETRRVQARRNGVGPLGRIAHQYRQVLAQAVAFAEQHESRAIGLGQRYLRLADALEGGHVAFVVTLHILEGHDQQGAVGDEGVHRLAA